MGWRDCRLEGGGRIAVAQLVLPGGPDYAKPPRLDAAILESLWSFVRLAPLHQPTNLAAIELGAERWPAMPQIACLDTAFKGHRLPFVDMIDVPWWLFDAGVPRTGFHGLCQDGGCPRVERILRGAASSSPISAAAARCVRSRANATAPGPCP